MAQPLMPALTSWRRIWRVALQVVYQQRTRSHQAPFSLQHVDQLRQFIQAGAAQKAATGACAWTKLYFLFSTTSRTMRGAQKSIIDPKN